jgi:hypothetical protein
MAEIYLARGEVCCFAPATLTWEPLGCGHHQLLRMLLGGELGSSSRTFAGRTGSLRWRAWPRTRASWFSRFCSARRVRTSAPLTADRVSMHELLDLYQDLALQVNE